MKASKVGSNTKLNKKERWGAAFIVGFLFALICKFLYLMFLAVLTDHFFGPETAQKIVVPIVNILYVAIFIGTSIGFYKFITKFDSGPGSKEG